MAGLLSENLNIELREFVSQSLADFGVEDKPNYREISHSERLNYCEDYLFLDDDLLFFEEQRASLREKYKQLDQQIVRKIRRVKQEKERLREAVRFCRIRVVPPESASKPTSLITPSRELNNAAG